MVKVKYFTFLENKKSNENVLYDLEKKIFLNIYKVYYRLMVN